MVVLLVGLGRIEYEVGVIAFVVFTHSLRMVVMGSACRVIVTLLTKVTGGCVMVEALGAGLVMVNVVDTVCVCFMEIVVGTVNDNVEILVMVFCCTTCIGLSEPHHP